MRVELVLAYMTLRLSRQKVVGSRDSCFGKGWKVRRKVVHSNQVIGNKDNEADFQHVAGSAPGQPGL